MERIQLINRSTTRERIYASDGQGLWFEPSQTLSLSYGAYLSRWKEALDNPPSWLDVVHPQLKKTNDVVGVPAPKGDTDPNTSTPMQTEEPGPESPAPAPARRLRSRPS